MFCAESCFWMTTNLWKLSHISRLCRQVTSIPQLWFHWHYHSDDPDRRWLILINTLRPRQNGRHFADDHLKRIFLNAINISLKFVAKSQINNIPALDQIMAWRRPGDKPLSEPMMIRWPTHICVFRPQRVNVATRLSIIVCIPLYELNCSATKACSNSQTLDLLTLDYFPQMWYFISN